ncbi:MFS transporter [Georgenia sunbinii]|uniref:MFS transporter n=1 Tax=Georgenia sunbinii TaxID=3117728 RepID=UPI002F26D243
MLNPYRGILARPGALQFSAAGLIARLPISMVGIGIVLMVSALYGSYGLAGRVSAVFVVTQAVCSPQLAKLIDRDGQARVMRPALAVACVGLAALIVAAVLHAPEYVLYATAVVGGSTIGSMGALVRARWARTVSTPGELHTAYALESALDELTFVAGPVIATLLATGVSAWSALVAPLVAALVGGYWLLSQTATEPPPSGRHDDATAAGGVMSPAMLVIMGIFLACGAVFGGADVSVVAFTEEAGAKQLAGLVLGAMALGSLISGLAYGARHWASPLWLRFILGTALLTAGTAAFLLAHSPAVLAAIAFVAGFAIAPTLINGNGLVQSLVPPRRLTEGFTWLGAAVGVGVSLGASVSGTVIDAVGARGGFVVIALAAALALVIAVAGFPTLRRRAGRELTV